MLSVVRVVLGRSLLGRVGTRVCAGREVVVAAPVEVVLLLVAPLEDVGVAVIDSHSSCESMTTVVVGRITVIGNHGHAGGRISVGRISVGRGWTGRGFDGRVSVGRVLVGRGLDTLVVGSALVGSALVGSVLVGSVLVTSTVDVGSLEGGTCDCSVVVDSVGAASVVSVGVAGLLLAVESAATAGSEVGTSVDSVGVAGSAEAGSCAVCVVTSADGCWLGVLSTREVRGSGTAEVASSPNGLAEDADSKDTPKVSVSDSALPVVWP